LTANRRFAKKIAVEMKTSFNSIRTNISGISKLKTNCLTMKSFRKLAVAGVVVMSTLATTNVFGQFLKLIPEYTGDAENTYMSGRAITPDGLFVAGNSGANLRGWIYSLASGTTINVLSSDNAQALTATGIGYRTSGGNTELLVAGLTSSGPAEWMTSNGGATWGIKRRNTVLSANIMGSANQLGSTIASDVYYVSSSRDVSAQPIYLSQISGTWGTWTVNEANKGLSGSDRGIMYGVSSIGRAVGRRGVNSTSYGAYVLDFATGTPTAYYINTLNDGQNGGLTTLGELWSVSQDGTAIFGRSFLTGTSGTYYGFKTTLTGFGGTHAQGAVNALPLFGDETGSTSLQVPYGASQDGKFAVGMDYRGAEHAVVWDTSASNPANWTITDLNDFAATAGIMDGWIRLSRAYSVADTGSGLMITGEGVWSPDGGTTLYTRAFVMLIPEPSAIWMLLGGLGLLIGRRLWIRQRA
jgi:hypothetical protein